MDHLAEAESLLATVPSSTGDVTNALMCHAMVSIAKDVRRLADAANPPA
jgi:hypothetical protein